MNSSSHPFSDQRYQGIQRAKTKFKPELLDFLGLRNDRPYYKSYIYKCMKSKLEDYKVGYSYRFPKDILSFLFGDSGRGHYGWYISQAAIKRTINQRFLAISQVNLSEKIIERKLFNDNNLNYGKPVTELIF